MTSRAALTRVATSAFACGNTPPATTWATSSFGSCGSRGGIGAASAAGMSSSPNPVRMSKPGTSTSFAVERSRSASCVTLIAPRTVLIHAAAAETIGAEKLVPLSST